MTDLELVTRFWHYGAGVMKEDSLRVMRDRGLLKKGDLLSVKALRLLGSRPGSWYCEVHGLNGLEKLKSQKECSCPHRQEK